LLAKAHQIQAQCSQIITDELLKNQNGDIVIRFEILRIKVDSPILPILTLKLVAMATSLKQSENGGKSVNYDQIRTIVHS